MINRREFGLRSLQLATALVLPARVFEQVVSGPHEVIVHRDVMVSMRDGVRLATDIYLPARGGQELAEPVPAILERTPYGKSQRTERHAGIGTAELLASHGYAVVYQDCRGRGKSEGRYVKYLSDGKDGYDCCKWIVHQPWCNGRIGTMGLSYAAHTQSALASAGAPGVTAMFMDSGGFSNAYQGGIRQGGAFELKQATWAFNQALEAPDIRSSPQRLAALRAVDLRAWFGRMPWSRGHSPLSLAPEYEAYLFDQWEHGSFDDYWKQLGLYAQGYYKDYSDAAMTIISSWYDVYTRTATENYVGLSKLKRGPICLILGPWTHGDREQTYSGDVDFGPAAAFSRGVAASYLETKLHWFDRHLKGVTHGLAAEPAVRLFVMGGGSGRRSAAGRMDHGGRWRTEAEWPIRRTRSTPFYLQSDGTLAEKPPQTDVPARVYRYDPRNPVPTIGGGITSGQPIMVGGAFDQREGARFYGSRQPYRPLAERPDVLVFQTPPLSSDVEITGPIAALLWIASDCPDTDFTLKLIDVYPPNEDYPEGYAMNLTDGILRCRYRDSWEHPTFMRPGHAYRIAIETFPTSNLFKAGHRIRVDISSSNFPRFDINPNTGEPEGRATTLRTATNRVFLDRGRPSHVILPIIPLAGSR